MSRPGDFQILIIDDEKVQREMLAGFLNKQGYRTVAVEDGVKGLERFSAGSFDLVLSDFRMPGMDGLALLKEMKRRNPEAVVIMMTAYGTVNTASTSEPFHSYSVPSWCRNWICESDTP